MSIEVFFLQLSLLPRCSLDVLVCFFGKLNLYIRRSDGTYVAASRVKAHYMTVTAMDDTWLTVSSWGRPYYIHRGEYEDYGKKHSIALVNNLVWLKAVTNKG